jgi:hypothetical protein
MECTLIVIIIFLIIAGVFLFMSKDKFTGNNIIEINGSKIPMQKLQRQYCENNYGDRPEDYITCIDQVMYG